MNVIAHSLLSKKKKKRRLKRANAVRKMAPIDLLELGLPQTFSLLKKMQYLQSTMKQSAIKLGMPVYHIEQDQ